MVTAEETPSPTTTRRVVGRYLLCDPIGKGGSATVHVGRLLGPVGFSRTVAIKQLHPELVKNPDLVAAFIDEARLAGRIQHANIVQTLDVVVADQELLLVMEYVHGESLSTLVRLLRAKGEAVPPAIASAIVIGALHGLAEAHSATSNNGEPLDLVHRDVSPQNILVGADGVPRVLDFGIAKATGRMQVTREGQVKGKLTYMAPEQLAGRPLDARTDLFAMSIVLWEALTGERLFAAEDPNETLTNVLEKVIVAPSKVRPEISPELDAVVLRGLARRAADRFPSARAMAKALEQACAPATTRQVREWIESLAGERLRERAQRVAAIESASDVPAPELPPPSSRRSEPVTAAAQPHPQARARRRYLVPIAVGASALLGVLFTLAAVRRTPPEPPRASASPQASASSVAGTNPSETAPLVSSSAVPVPVTSARSAPAPHVRAQKVAPVTDCDPPYTMDAKGIRHPKPRCL